MDTYILFYPLFIEVSSCLTRIFWRQKLFSINARALSIRIDNALLYRETDVQASGFLFLDVYVCFSLHIWNLKWYSRQQIQIEFSYLIYR